MRPTVRRALPALLLALPATGCYEYLPLGAAPRPEALPVRVTLASSGTARVAAAFGPFIGTLDGTLDAASPADSVRLVVYATYHQTGFRTDVPGVPVTLAAGDVTETRHRRLNVAKTTVLSVVLGATVLSLPELVRRAGGGGGTSTGPGPVQP